MDDFGRRRKGRRLKTMEKDKEQNSCERWSINYSINQQVKRWHVTRP